MSAPGGRPLKTWRRADHITSAERLDPKLEKACKIMADTFGGLHNVPGKVCDFGVLVELIVTCDLATYDFGRLTQLVIGAHRYCCRVSVLPASSRHLRIWFHNRRPHGDVTQRHPSMHALASLDPPEQATAERLRELRDVLERLKATILTKPAARLVELKAERDAVRQLNDHQTDVIDRLKAENEKLRKGASWNNFVAMTYENEWLKYALKQWQAENEPLRAALEFYGDPETYVAIALLADPPCGAFVEDISDTGEPWGERPGKRARQALGEETP